MFVLLLVAIVVASTGLVWVGTGFLDDATESLSTYYRVPAVVQGAVLAAVGSSFPELSTVVLSTALHGTFDLGVSAIVGSAIFNILVIPGIAGIVADGPSMRTSRDLIYKEAQFYLVAVSVLLLTFSLAAIYHPVEGARIRGRVTRTLALLPIGLYGLYLFLQYQDTMDHDSDEDVSAIEPLREWGKLVGSLAVIVVGVEGLVRSAIHFGEYFETPETFWGLTIVAAGTSIPDAFVSVRASRSDRPLVSIANVLGSNVFDLLVAIPAGVLIAGASVVDYSIAAPMMGVLIVATVTLFTFLRTNMRLSQIESVVLLVLYGLFVAWMFLETADVLDWTPPM